MTGRVLEKLVYNKKVLLAPISFFNTWIKEIFRFVG